MFAQCALSESHCSLWSGESPGGLENFCFFNVHLLPIESIYCFKANSSFFFINH